MLLFQGDGGCLRDISLGWRGRNVELNRLKWVPLLPVVIQDHQHDTHERIISSILIRATQEPGFPLEPLGRELVDRLWPIPKRATSPHQSSPRQLAERFSGRVVDGNLPLPLDVQAEKGEGGGGEGDGFHDRSLPE